MTKVRRSQVMSLPKEFLENPSVSVVRRTFKFNHETRTIEDELYVGHRKEAPEGYIELDELAQITRDGPVRVSIPPT